MEKMYHIGFDASHGARYTILPGDPGRVESIAAKLDSPRFYCQKREYAAWLGYLAGEPVLVMSTGMGGPSTAIGAEELYRTGVKSFLRVGTCGGIADKVKGGDIVIATGSVRMEGTTREYVPIEFPAVADLSVTNALVAAAKAKKARFFAGIVQSKDSFYGELEPDRMPVAAELKNKWEAWKRAGCLASEMESAALYIVAQVLGARAGCVLNVINDEQSREELKGTWGHDMSLVTDIAVDAVRRLIAEDSAKM